jgi:hypothetical protein
MNEVQIVPLTRPPQIPPEVSDAEVLEAVRDYLFGTPHHEIELRLAVPHQTFTAILRTGAWRLLQNQFRDEFVATTGGRLIRLQQKLLDKLEGYIDDGIAAYTNDGEKYTRSLSPKEACGIAQVLSEENKRIDKLKDGDIDRRSFNAREHQQRLERIANATEIEGQRVG